MLCLSVLVVRFYPLTVNASLSLARTIVLKLCRRLSVLCTTLQPRS
uniref:Uncharacterized protein n=1 Tax=Anopheles quadriannulatus TaxID=34691 RepID=A0A182XS71_ANOQN